MKHFRYWVIALAFTSTAWAHEGTHSAIETHAHHEAHVDWTRGKIVKIDAEKAIIVLKHQRIKSIDMDAMTMPFKVEDQTMFARFKVGAAVRFTVKVVNDHLVIAAMEKAK